MSALKVFILYDGKVQESYPRKKILRSYLTESGTEGVLWVIEGLNFTRFWCQNDIYFHNTFNEITNGDPADVIFF